jgi:signal recognition particle receptor subunit beta
MSRHRNVRNLIAEDDYYDDDYDDYGDDYDDYGDCSYSKPKATSNAKGNASTSKNQQQQQQQQQPKKPVPKTSTTDSKPPVTATKPTATTTAIATGGKTAAHATSPNMPKSPTPQPPPTNGEKPIAGIVRPPPGWGTPQEIPRGPTPVDSTAAIQQPEQQQPVPRVLQESFLQNDHSSSESQLSLVVIGHVDAGKSTLLGHLLYQAGLVSKRQVQKGMESTGGATSKGGTSDNKNIPWAWLLDEDEGERTRGVTMNLATKTLSTPHHPHVVLVDAPGHADFVPTMITGAAHADAALLVVDASSESAFQAAFARGGQTKEHLLVARGLGVSQLVVCINKLDVPQWSQHVFDDIQQRLWPFLTQRAGFNPARIRFVPTSGLTGINIMNNHTITNNNHNKSPAISQILSPPSLTQWYKGPSLYEMIDSFQPVKNANLGMLRPSIYYRQDHHVRMQYF